MNPLRRYIAQFATAFPPKAVSDRLLPYVTLLLAVAGGVSALIQYSNGLAIARVTATMELHKQFLSETFRPAVKEFNEFNTRANQIAPKARCEFIRDAIAKGEVSASSGTSLNCDKFDNATLTALDKVSLTDAQRDRLREFALWRRREVNPPWPSIDQLELFYRSLIVCVERNNCSGDTAAALFAREMVTFVNATCDYDSPVAVGHTTNDEIARFLVRSRVNKNIYWNRDANRKKLFACDRQRTLEY
jgi:hypothetical protein